MAPQRCTGSNPETHEYVTLHEKRLCRYNKVKHIKMGRLSGWPNVITGSLWGKERGRRLKEGGLMINAEVGVKVEEGHKAKESRWLLGCRKGKEQIHFQSLPEEHSSTNTLILVYLRFLTSKL